MSDLRFVKAEFHIKRNTNNNNQTAKQTIKQTIKNNKTITYNKYLK